MPKWRVMKLRRGVNAIERLGAGNCLNLSFVVKFLHEFPLADQQAKAPHS